MKMANTRLIVLLCCAIVAGSCQNKGNTPNNGQNEAPAIAAVPATAADTLITIIPGEFIVSYSDALIQELKLTFINKKSTTFAQQQANLVAEASRQLKSELKAIDPEIEITGATSVCAFVKSDKDLTAIADKALLFTKVSNIQPNYKVKVIVEKPAVAAPPARELQWGVEHVRNIQPVNGTFKPVWILDSGIDPTHNDLNVDVINSRSFVAGETVNDGLGHGTHVAGIIGALANGRGVVGVAPNTPIRALKVINNAGYMTLADWLTALQHVIDNGKAGQVVNMSLFRGFGADNNESRLIADIARGGMYVVMAATNTNNTGARVNINTYRNGVYPAVINGNKIFTVSAMDVNHAYFNLSNYGASVDYAAPGVDIVSTTPGNAYTSMSGTSMAAPHVSGLLLLHNGIIDSQGTVSGDPDGQPDPIAHEH